MGSKFFKEKANPGVHPSSGMNMMARAVSSSGFGARAAGGAAAKDLGAASAFNAKGTAAMKPLSKTAASNAVGPKRT